jgi:undecaprenyl diphosphate synthase
MVFLDTLFPDFDCRHLWEAVEIYAGRNRRFGGAVDKASPCTARPTSPPRPPRRESTD